MTDGAEHQRLCDGLNVLVLSPTPTHPQDFGNRKRIFQVCKRFSDEGARITFVHYPAELEWRGKVPPSAERAMQAFDEVVRKYPNSEYAVSAKRKIEVGRDNMAAREMMVGRYYMERRDYTGAINRFTIVVTRYQTTRHVEEALLRLTEAYLSLGIVGEAQTSAAVLGHNFPDSRWYKDAYALVQQRGLQPSENKGSWISQAFRLG